MVEQEKDLKNEEVKAVVQEEQEVKGEQKVQEEALVMDFSNAFKSDTRRGKKKKPKLSSKVGKDGEEEKD